MTNHNPRFSTRVLVHWTPQSQEESAAAKSDAVSLAAWFARTTPVTVRAVATFQRPWPQYSFRNLGGRYRSWFGQQQRRYHESVRAAFRAAGIPRTSWDDEVAIFADGPAEHQLIADAATEFDADVIVLGPDAAAAKGRFLAGSTADTLLHNSPKPLALAPRSAQLAKRGVRRVNFSYLDSDDTAEPPGLLEAAALADAWHVPLRILAFSPTDITHSLVDAEFNMEKLGAKLAHDWREFSLGLLDRARDRVGAAFPELELSSEIGTGTGWSCAVGAVKWKKGDLLVLGSNPVGPIARVFIGNVTTDFLRHVSVPVVIYPAET